MFLLEQVERDGSGIVGFEQLVALVFQLLLPRGQALDVLLAVGLDMFELRAQVALDLAAIIGLPGVSRTALKAVFQAACLVARCSSSTSLGVLCPRAEWSRF